MVNEEEPKVARDAFPSQVLQTIVEVIDDKLYAILGAKDTESLVICVLGLLWGFRPATLMQIKMYEHVAITDDAITFTEAFRKSY
jgi:hypothetical protein